MKKIITIISALITTITIAQTNLTYNYTIDVNSSTTNSIDTIDLGEVLIGGVSDTIFINLTNNLSSAYYPYFSQPFTTNPNESIIAGRAFVNTDNYCESESGFTTMIGDVQSISGRSTISHFIVFTPKDQYRFRKINAQGTACNGTIEQVSGQGVYQKLFNVGAFDENDNTVNYRILIQANGVDQLTNLKTNSNYSSKGEIVKAYNLQGQEVSTNTKGEVIILQYDNGVREKVFIQK